MSARPSLAVGDPASAVPLRRLWLLLCIVLIAAGVYLRVQQLGEPPGLSWDEHHFVKNARNYLAGRPDWNDHPPLGKLLMAASIATFGDTAVAFRLPSLVAGIATLVLGGLLARRLFGSARAGLLAAAFLAVDGFLLAYSRTALLDGMLTCATFAATLLSLSATGLWRLLAAAVMAACAVSLKTSGALAGVPVLIAAYRLRPRWAVLCVLAVVPLLFYAQWAVGRAMGGEPWGPLAVWDKQWALMRHHAGLTDWKHPLTSHWYTWLLPLRTLPLRSLVDPDGRLRVMNSLGHPLLWWSVSALVVGLSLRTLRQWARRLLLGGRRPAPAAGAGASEPTAPGVHHDPAVPAAAALDHVAVPRDGARGFFARTFGGGGTLVVLGMWWLYMAPWILTPRDSYVYHYLPSYAFGLLLPARALDGLAARRPWLALGLLTVVAAGFVFYAPVWGQLPLTRHAVHWRLFFPGWR